jgi:hypothetical protein
MAVATYPERRQINPRDVTARGNETISPAFYCRPGVNPEGVLIEKVAPQKEMGHTSEFPCIVKPRVGSAGRIHAHNGAEAIGMAHRGGQSEVASLAMGQQDGATFHTLHEGVIGMLGQHIVAAPSGDALAEKGVERLNRKAQAGMGPPQPGVGIPRALRAETERLFSSLLCGPEIGRLCIHLWVGRPGGAPALDGI